MSPFTKQNNKNLPALKDLVKIRDNKVIFVDWYMDFYLINILANGEDRVYRRKAEQNRSRLYNLLSMKKVLYPISPKLDKNNIYTYEDRKCLDGDSPEFQDFYRIGPVYNNITYSFNRSYGRIVENWVDAYKMWHPHPYNEIIIPDV